MKIKLFYRTKIYIAFLLSTTTVISGCERLYANNPTVPIAESWEVIKVSDGDTITVRQSGTERKIRLCGIDAPESKQPLGKESKGNLQRLSNEVGGQISIVPVESDRYGRLVAEIFSSKNGIEKFWNEEQLSSGNAYLYKQYVGKCPNKIALENGEAIAKSKKLGVWGGNYQKPWDYRRERRNR